MRQQVIELVRMAKKRRKETTSGRETYLHSFVKRRT
jgi:hypothetical protein